KVFFSLAATPAVIGAAYADPLNTNSPEGLLAKGFFNSVFGSGPYGNHYTTAAEQAAATLAGVTTPWTPAQFAIYTKYKALAEEADAYRVQTRVREFWQPPAPPPPPPPPPPAPPPPAPAPLTPPAPAPTPPQPGH